MPNKELKKARIDAELTQKEIAKLMGVNIATYVRKENGLREFTESEILKLSKLLKKDPNEIFFNNRLPKDNKKGRDDE